MVSSRCHGQSWVVISRSSTHEQYDLFFIVLRTQWNLCWSCFPDYFVIALIILIVVALKVVLSFFFFFLFSLLRLISILLLIEMWNLAIIPAVSFSSCLRNALYSISLSWNSSKPISITHALTTAVGCLNSIRCGTNELMMDNSSPMSQMKPRYPTMDLVPWLSNSWSISPIAWEDEELAQHFARQLHAVVVVLFDKLGIDITRSDRDKRIPWKRGLSCLFQTKLPVGTLLSFSLQ